MSAFDEVAGLPGGAGLAALADRVETARPEAVREIAARWKQAAATGGDSGNAVKQAVVGLDGAWEGGSADGFVAYMGEFARCGTALTDALTAAAGDLESVAAALESAKSSVERICEDLLSRVRRLRRQAHGMPQEDLDSAIRGMCASEKESRGNPHAINDWDSNAAKGTPSKGLMQCIDPTFQAHKLPGHDDIWNPVDNIIAGVRYTFSRYGGFEATRA